MCFNKTDSLWNRGYRLKYKNFNTFYNQYLLKKNYKFKPLQYVNEKFLNEYYDCTVFWFNFYFNYHYCTDHLKPYINNRRGNRSLTFVQRLDKHFTQKYDFKLKFLRLLKKYDKKYFNKKFKKYLKQYFLNLKEKKQKQIIYVRTWIVLSLVNSFENEFNFEYPYIYEFDNQNYFRFKKEYNYLLLNKLILLIEKKTIHIKPIIFLNQLYETEFYYFEFINSTTYKFRDCFLKNYLIYDPTSIQLETIQNIQNDLDCLTDLFFKRYANFKSIN